MTDSSDCPSVSRTSETSRRTCRLPRARSWRRVDVAMMARQGGSFIVCGPLPRVPGSPSLRVQLDNENNRALVCGQSTLSHPTLTDDTIVVGIHPTVLLRPSQPATGPNRLACPYVPTRSTSTSRPKQSLPIPHVRQSLEVWIDTLPSK